MAAGLTDVAELEARAAAAVRRYNRTTWIRFTITFFPVPLVVVILRLQVDAWVYYIYGAAIVALTLSMYLLDGAARDRRDTAIRAAEEARAAATPQD
jgi:hypothetical protein